VPGTDAGGAPGATPLDQAALRWAMPGVVDAHPGRWLEGPPDVDELLRQVVDGSAGLTGAADGLIWLVEDEGKRLLVRCGTGRFTDSAGQAARFGEGLAGSTWERAVPVAVDDYQAWPGRAAEGLGEGEVRAVLAAPLVSAGTVIGVLGLAAEPGGRFGEAEVALMRVLGELAGAAVDHAQREHAAHRRLLEQATTEAWLRANELRYRTLIEQIDAVTYSEAFAVGGAQMMYVSPQVQDKLGYTPEEVGQPGFWKELVHPDDRERVLAQDEQVELTGSPWRIEYRVVGRDGRVLWIRDHAVLVRDGRGRPAFWQGLWIDVTDQKLAEQAMREALELEREATRRLRALDELKNTFLDAVSHELRTPLASVIGIALTLQRARASLAPGDADDLIDRLVSSAAKLDQLLSDLLDLDRLSRGIIAPKLRRTDVAALVARVAVEWEAEHGRRLGMHLDPVVARVDPAKVERIVENLLSNAARHTTQATPVWVRVAPRRRRAGRGRRRGRRRARRAARRAVRAVPPRPQRARLRARRRHRPLAGGALRGAARRPRLGGGPARRRLLLPGAATRPAGLGRRAGGPVRAGRAPRPPRRHHRARVPARAQAGRTSRATGATAGRRREHEVNRTLPSSTAGYTHGQRDPSTVTTGAAMERALVLNASYQPICVVPVRRAVVLVLKEKADVLVPRDALVRGATIAIQAPSVIRLRYVVKVPFRARAGLSRRAVFVRDDHTCQYCGGRAENVDHVIPRSRGGLHVWENVVAACRRCNSRKEDRLPHEVGFRLRREPRAPKETLWIVIAVGQIDPGWVPYLGVEPSTAVPA
jgi:PAS domain S-box-containing protein